MKLVKNSNAAKKKKSGGNKRDTKAAIRSVPKSKRLKSLDSGKRGKTPAGKNPNRKWIVLTGITVLFLVLSGAAFYILVHFRVETVYVEGNVHYTREEIQEQVMSGRLGHNSLYLSLKYRNKGIKGVPFVEMMDVKVLSPDTIRITVYEKAVAGYVEYLDKYMYFDKDGIVVESSDSKTVGIPQVEGIEFDHIILHEPLPVENHDVFSEILYVTQLLTKYNITTDKIYFDASYEMTLYFGKLRAKVGKDDNLEEKIVRLQYILTGLEGKSGVIYLENYSDSSPNTTVDLD